MLTIYQLILSTISTKLFKDRNSPPTSATGVKLQYVKTSCSTSETNLTIFSSVVKNFLFEFSMMKHILLGASV